MNIGPIVFSGAGDHAPAWIGDVMIAALVLAPVVVGLTWRCVDRLLGRRRTHETPED